MHSSRHLIMGVVALLAVVALTVGLFIWPNYREAARIQREISDLHNRIKGLESQAQVVDQLKAEVTIAQRRIASELKSIPQSPDVASLIRSLSQDVDRVSVVDQTFTAGSQCDAMTGEKLALQAMPLTVDMDATFESVFALIRNAESLERLVRVVSVRVLCKRDDKTMGPSILKASVGLEAIFEPPQAQVQASSSEGI